MNEIYVTGVVIPNGIADHEGDVLNKKDILKIFTKYIERSTDTMHTKIKNTGVDVLANWISETDNTIAGKTAPSGSWLATLKISNPEIIKSIQDGDITGFSLGSIPDFALTQKYWFINKSMNYRDLDDAEEVIPLFISLVDLPSNGFGFEIMDYDAYINKRVHEEDNMTDKNIEVNNNEEKVSMGTLEKIADIFGINKKVDGEKLETEKVEIQKNANADMSNSELLNAIDEKFDSISENVTAGVVSAFEKLPEIMKGKEEAAEPVKTEEPAKEDEEKEPAKEDKEDKPEDVEINKRATSKTENIEQPNKTTNFYKLSGRTTDGCRIRK